MTRRGGHGEQIVELGQPNELSVRVQRERRDRSRWADTRAALAKGLPAACHKLHTTRFATRPTTFSDMILFQGIRVARRDRARQD